MPIEVLISLFFITALFYSLVGFGGGSLYLALLVLSSLSYEIIPSTALICNIIVVSGGCYYFTKEKYFSLRLALPFLLTSIPFAFIGGRLPVPKTVFLLLLGGSLFVASLRLFISDKEKQKVVRVTTCHLWMYGLPLGATLGFLSGLVGIGGGIFLAPVFYFLRWASARTIAATASFFILVNSASGLLGQLIKRSFVLDWRVILPLAIAVFFGGQIGSRLSSQKLNVNVLKKLTATLILFVSIRILVQTLA